MQLMKNLELREIGETVVEVDGIGLYTLGKYRQELTEDQKQNIKNF